MVNKSIPGVTNYGTTCVYGKNYSFCDWCGVQPIKPNIKIVGGKDALKNSWPAMVFLKVFVNGETYACGGTLIDRKTVLTAAHCLIPEATVLVYLGLHDRSDIETGSDYTMIKSSQIIIVYFKFSFLIQYKVFF